MEAWRVPQGSRESRVVTIKDGDGEAIAYAGTETLSAKLWIGLDQTTLLTLTPTWVSGPDGEISVVLTSAQTAALAVGQYRLVCYVTDGTGTYAAAEELVIITAAPGAAASRPTYCTVVDLRKIDAQVEDLQDPELGETGFADQCADAREWLDECILRSYRGGGVTLLGMHGLALDAWYTGGSRRTSLGNPWIKAQLAANCLLVTARIKRVCALYAMYLINDGCKNRGKEYQAAAARYLHQAHQALVCTVAELNLNGDGVTAHLPINLSSSNTLFA